MSVEDLKAYGKMCTEDEAVRAKAKDIGLEDVDGQIANAAAHDLHFDQRDLDSLAKEVGSGDAELSEDDLENVAGGFVTALAAAVVGASVAVATAATSVSSSTSGSGW